jgi:PiT family inorganic phosphate transporter
MDVPVAALTSGSIFFLISAVGLALAFEFVNGFHDTANAVATVIYTNTMRPWMAVIWSGCWNLLGVLTSSGAVAFGILALLPVELVVNAGSSAGFTMVFALLLSAIFWNLGTWWLGLPASSSHSLIGSIMGVGMVNSLISKGHSFGDGVNWGKAKDVFMALLISPVVGFVCAAVLLLMLKVVARRKRELFDAPTPNQPPPLWIRSILVVTCTGVSFAHGSNDGQKGMGLILLILIGILPGMYALNMSGDDSTVKRLQEAAASAQVIFDAQPGSTTVVSDAEQAEVLSAFLRPSGKVSPQTFSALAMANHHLSDLIAAKTRLSDLSESERRQVRSQTYLIGESIGKLNKLHAVSDAKQHDSLMAYRSTLDGLTKFIPLWVKIAVALSLGLGTMIGWKRIVVTVGEKIGKSHLTYAQGASAELVAMTTIGAADIYGLPVSTTHVLSSGVAGAMAANGSGLQMKTLVSLLLAWVLTLPVCVILGSGIFAAGLYVLFTVMGTPLP